MTKNEIIPLAPTRREVLPQVVRTDWPEDDAKWRHLSRTRSLPTAVNCCAHALAMRMHAKVNAGNCDSQSGASARRLALSDEAVNAPSAASIPAAKADACRNIEPAAYPFVHRETRDLGAVRQPKQCFMTSPVCSTSRSGMRLKQGGLP